MLIGRHSFIRQNKLSDVTGRIDYISNPKRQEHLYCDLLDGWSNTGVLEESCERESVDDSIDSYERGVLPIPPFQQKKTSRPQKAGSQPECGHQHAEPFSHTIFCRNRHIAELLCQNSAHSITH